MTTEAGELSTGEELDLHYWGKLYSEAQTDLIDVRGRLRASVLRAHERGIKPPRIAELVGLSRQSVHDILKKGER